MACLKTSIDIDSILSEKQIHSIVERSLGVTCGQIIACDKRAAAPGLAGFLGEHSRVTIHVKVDGAVKKIKLFVKTVPSHNKPKADIITKNGYFKREMLALNLAEEMGAVEGPNPWCPKVYLCTETTLVMPDLAFDGYKTFRNYETLDLKHTLITTASIARFHAAFANYVTKRSLDDKRPYNFLEKYSELMIEPTFCDSLWLRAAAKLTVNFLQEFSEKFSLYPQNLESTLVEKYIEACATLKEYDGTLNLILHKDLWINNIMFKHSGDEPVNALLIDYQCLRYGPPAFDLMIFLYLTTPRQFRESREKEVICYYFDLFNKSLDVATRDSLREINYDLQSFSMWCERARMFAAFEAIGIFPYVLMDPTLAQTTFDDPDTFMKYCDEDRTKPVLAYSHTSKVYMERQLEVNEEFIERYVLKQP